MTGTTRRNLLLAATGSFLVYLMPIYTVHFSMPWGTVMWIELTRAGAGRGLGWLAADLGLAALLQLSAGAVIYWFAAHPRIWRFLIALTTVPVFFIALQAAYLHILPALFLIEGEAHAEHGDWPTVCAVPGAAVAPIDQGPSAPLLRSGEAWLISSKGRYSRLTSSRCALRNLSLSVSRATVIQAIAGGGALFTRRDTATGESRPHALLPGGRTLELSPPPGTEHWHPVLAEDGSAIAWLERAAQDRRGWRIVVRPLADGDGKERAIPLRLPGPASVRLVGFAAGGAGFLARRNEREFVAIDDEGRIAPLVEAPDPGTQPTHMFLRTPAGWVSWDVYRDEGRLRVAWMLNGKAGAHEVPRGRGINHVSVTPEGSLIAMSVGSNVTVGSVKDAVYVLRAADGREVFRRFLARYTRSRPVFIDNRHMALTLREGRAPLVQVLRVPAEARVP